MSTKACIIKLEKDVCKAAYIHYGADFVSRFVFQEFLGEELWNTVFDAAKEWDENAELENCYYQEITDAEHIERLHRYDANFIDMDAEFFIFVEYNSDNELYDITIKRTTSDEGEWWNEEWLADDEEREMVRKFVGVE